MRSRPSHLSAHIVRQGKAPWILMLAVGGLLLAGAFALDATLKAAIERRVRSALHIVQHERVTSLKLFANGRFGLTEQLATAPRIRTHLLNLLQGTAATPEQREAEAKALATELEPTIAGLTSFGFVALDARGVGVSQYKGQLAHVDIPLVHLPFASEALAGKSQFSAPFPVTGSNAALGGDSALVIWTPVKGDDGHAAGLFGLRFNPFRGFALLLGTDDKGEHDSMESYAVDREGMLVSASRFEAELRRVGLLEADQPSSMHVAARDPGGDLASGFQPTFKRSEQPLTRMAQAVTARADGSDIEGYRNYRGVPVVGTWNWVPELNIGIATEMGADDAFEALQPLRLGFWLLSAALVAAALFAFFYGARARNLEQTVEAAAQLGRYNLGRKLGEGGMGAVYEANHAMLARRAAIKMLKGTGHTEEQRARFEREVRITAQLTHPNTIAVYDFGYAPDGTFYYAMEYVEGIDLDSLVRVHGPLAVDRVIHILAQLAGSLAEAHEAGLIHRDIKPANIMLTSRGGVPDFVKVLDFGLARSVDTAAATKLTGAGQFLGTPLYMAPEAMSAPDSVDARVDVYAVGTVAYYLLSGRDAFAGDSITEIVAKHLRGGYPPLGDHIPQGLRDLIDRCMRMLPEERPASGRALHLELAKLQRETPWDLQGAETFWRNFAQGSQGARVAESVAESPTVAATT